MAPATTSPFSECEKMKHIIDIPVPEEQKLSKCSIYKVPCNLKKLNKDAYTPQLISIGPIHLGNEELKEMQEHKQRYFLFFWVRVCNEEAMKNYKQYLVDNEEEIRQCYYAHKFPEDLDSTEKFVNMMLLDAVFIMELLLRNSFWNSDTSTHEHDYSDDSILTQPWLSKSIARDFILLENQIPFFVLKELYDTVVPGDNKKDFADLAFEYFAAFYDTQRTSSDETKDITQRNQSRCCSLRSSNKSLDKSPNRDGCKNPEHFTDLIRYFYLPTTELGKSGDPDRVLRTATKLQKAGVSFEKVLKGHLLDISFDKKRILSSFLCLGCLPYLNHFKARFRIPQLKVDHTTECVFRNLIAFEQCHYPDQPYICNYVSLVDSLIHTQVDVELLVEKEVIVHELGSDKEVATLVNGLCKQVVTNSTCYYKLITDLNKHYQNTWNRTMAALRLVYFRDPWRASSTLVGIAVLIFTIFNFLRAMESLRMIT